MANAATSILFIEFPDLHIDLDPFIDYVYISGSCWFRLYFFFCRDFAVPLTHPLFDPSAPYIAIPLYMAHSFPPPPTTAVPAAAPTASPSQQVPSITPSKEEDSSEATSSSSSSSAPGGGFTPTDAGMVDGFLSSESI